MTQRQTKKKIGGVRLGTKGNISKGVHLRNKKYTGGLRFGTKYDGTEYTDQEAFSFFLENIKQSEILTDSSIASITLVLTINDDGIKNFPYPYYSTRQDTFDEPLKKILLKVLVSSVKEGTAIYEDDHGSFYFDSYRGKNTTQKCEITSNDMLNEEVFIQKRIYMRSFLDEQNMLDPICPAILGFIEEQQIQVQTKKDLLRLILSKLVATPPTFINQDKKILEEFFSNGISLICMEYLEGYSLVNNFIDDENIGYLSLYELLKMYEYGYMHDDFHENLMVNYNYGYAIPDTQEIIPGKIKIIDFGRAKEIDPSYFRFYNTRMGMNVDLTFNQYSIINKINFIFFTINPESFFKIRSEYNSLLSDSGYNYSRKIYEISSIISSFIEEQKIISKSFISNVGNKKTLNLIHNLSVMYGFQEKQELQQAPRTSPVAQTPGATSRAPQRAQGATSRAPPGAPPGAPQRANTPGTQTQRKTRVPQRAKTPGTQTPGTQTQGTQTQRKTRVPPKMPSRVSRNLSARTEGK